MRGDMPLEGVSLGLCLQLLFVALDSMSQGQGRICPILTWPLWSL